MDKKKMPSGGERKGAGRKKKYGEETVVVSFKVPLTKAEAFKKKNEALLKKWEIKKKKP